MRSPIRARRPAPAGLALALLLVAAPALGQADGGRGHGATCGDNLAPVDPGPAITVPEICATIAVLAADSLEGREAGTPGAERAAEYLARRFAAIGLRPPGDGGYRQPFEFLARLKSDPHAGRETAAPGESAGGEVLSTANVVGLVEGTDPDLRDEAIVVGAHYDHLGRGAAGSLAPGSDEIHNGADDNASGVAGLLELAERFADDPPRRSLVFVAFGGEELGNLGSQHWVKAPAWPLDRTVAMINLDMIGRLRERLTVYGTGTSPAWPEILDRLEHLPGAPELQRVPDGYGPSDHASFYGAGIPVLALFTGTHEQYHRPEDDAGLVHAAGEARVVELAAAAIEAVARSSVEVPYVEAPRTERRAMAFSVGLGVVPDYGFVGEGLALSSVRADGPADRAGLEAGDVVVRLAGREVGDVYDYTEILAGLEAGVAVHVEYLRDGERRAATVVPESR